MHSSPDKSGPNTGDPVISVMKIKIDAIEALDLLAEAIEVLNSEWKRLTGFLSGQILLSVDNTTMMIVTEWTNRHAWAKSRYDLRVGKLIEHCLVKSTTIEFELYNRHGEVPRTADQRKARQAHD